MGVKKYIVRLTEEERIGLRAVVSKGRASARKIGHARVLLKVDADGPNWTDEEAAEAFGIRANTVRDIRQRFVEEGLEAALERKRRTEPPTPRKLDGAGEARLIALACGEPPEGRARGTLHKIASSMRGRASVDGISHATGRPPRKRTGS